MIDPRPSELGPHLVKLTKYFRDLKDVWCGNRVLDEALFSDESRQLSGFPDPSAFAQAYSSTIEDDELIEPMFRLALATLIRAGKPIPSEARELAAQMISGTWKRRKKPGKSRAINRTRDFAIALEIEGLVTYFKIPATRNRAQNKRDCACSLVRQCLEDAGVHLSEDAIVKIWEQKRSQWRWKHHASIG